MHRVSSSLFSVINSPLSSVSVSFTLLLPPQHLHAHPQGLQSPNEILPRRETYLAAGWSSEGQLVAWRLWSLIEYSNRSLGVILSIYAGSAKLGQPWDWSDTKKKMKSTQVLECVECHTTKTPMWRGGPAGPRVWIDLILRSIVFFAHLLCSICFNPIDQTLVDQLPVIMFCF